ncbi:MAG: class I SAM-dependent methyltransferase [Candidatus Paceibacterota bacterium]|jgi:ubiquinone/menaquinone biosynthesis C-methylase UbiE
MEKLSENFYEENDENEKVFQRYVENLELTSEDFDKKILDIGSGYGGFSKWAKDHNVSSEIYSIDLWETPKEKENSVNGSAEELPFKNDSFDLIVSNCAIPNVIDVEKIEKALSEAIRVTKPGGEIRLARVLEGGLYEPQKIRKQEVDSILEKLKNKDLKIQKIRQPHGDAYEYDESGNATRVLSEAYLLKIKKPET